VIGLRPGITWSWTTPSIDNIAFGVKFDDWRSRRTALGYAVVEAEFLAGKITVLVTMNDVNVIPGVYGDADGGTQYPAVRQGCGQNGSTTIIGAKRSLLAAETVWFNWFWPSCSA